MSKTKASDDCSPRPAEATVVRLDYCCRMLLVWGIITDGEKPKVLRRLRRVAAKLTRDR